MPEWKVRKVVDDHPVLEAPGYLPVRVDPDPELKQGSRHWGAVFPSKHGGWKFYQMSRDMTELLDEMAVAHHSKN